MDVTDAITAPLSLPIKQAIASTVLSLTKIQSRVGGEHSLSSFHPDHLLILPPQSRNIPLPGHKLLQHFTELTVLANQAAESLSCSSILAAHSSEGDDTGDIALWLGEGEYGPGKEENVLELFGLAPWLRQGAQVVNVQLLSSQLPLPSTLSTNQPTHMVNSLAEKINEMTNKHCFRISSPSSTPIVIFFLVGHLSGHETTGWGGLVGVGTWSDE